jgi:hypothetical protein
MNYNVIARLRGEKKRDNPASTSTLQEIITTQPDIGQILCCVKGLFTLMCRVLILAPRLLFYATGLHIVFLQSYPFECHSPSPTVQNQL